MVVSVSKVLIGSLCNHNGVSNRQYMYSPMAMGQETSQHDYSSQDRRGIRILSIKDVNQKNGFTLFQTSLLLFHLVQFVNCTGHTVVNT